MTITLIDDCSHRQAAPAFVSTLASSGISALISAPMWSWAFPIERSRAAGARRALKHPLGIVFAISFAGRSTCGGSRPRRRRSATR
jgi:hypothetical protein